MQEPSVEVEPAAAATQEALRLSALRALDLMDTAPEERFDRLVQVAATCMKAPMAFISLLDATRCWFKAARGLGVAELPRELSFCHRALAHPGPYVVEDALGHPELRTNPLVVGPPHIRFYAGVPLRNTRGFVLGYLAVADTEARQPAADELAALGTLARLVEDEFARTEARGAGQPELVSARTLADQKDLLERVIAHTPAGISYLDKDLVYRSTNPMQLMFMGTTAEHVVDKTLIEVWGPEADAQVGELLRGVLRTGEPFSAVAFPFEGVIEGKPKKFFWDFTYAAVRNPDGQVEGVLVLTQEVSLRVAQEQEQARLREEVEARNQTLAASNALLAEQKHFAETLVNSAPLAISYLDRALRYVQANPKALAEAGRTLEDMLGHTIFEVGGPETERQLGDTFRRALAGETVIGTAFTFRFTHEGQERSAVFDFSALPIRDRAGEVGGVLVIAQDATERAELDRLQRQRIRDLEEANVHKEQFLGIISHELRTPLNAIQGFSSIMEDGLAGELSPQQAGYLGKVLAASDHMLGLINDLLDLSRVQAGKFKLVLGPVPPAPVLHAALAEQAEAIAAKGHALVDRLPPELPSVRGDARRIAQVFANLLTNAAKYTDPGGTITVEARVEGQALKVSVADTGIGIAPDQQGRIFESFTQVDMTSTRAQGGVGLGLSIVKALVEAQGGEVGVESAPGVGSTFWFTLPLASG